MTIFKKAIGSIGSRPYSGANWQVSTDSVCTIGKSCKKMRKLSLLKDLYFWQDYPQRYFCKTFAKHLYPSKRIGWHEIIQNGGDVFFVTNK